MSSPTNILDGAVLLLFTPIDSRHRRTGACTHTVGGIVNPPFSGLAICQYENESGFYLFYCAENWAVITDTFHESIDDAKDQAAFEFEGVTATWQKPQSKQ